MQELDSECVLITKYLVNQTPPAELIERYRAAHAKLLGDAGSERDLAIIAFTQKHPWSLRYIDAAVAVLRPNALLRKKILVMMAIVETAPHYVEYFIPKRTPLIKIILNMVWYGTATMCSFLIGVCIYPLAARLR